MYYDNEVALSVPVPITSSIAQQQNIPRSNLQPVTVAGSRFHHVYGGLNQQQILVPQWASKDCFWLNQRDEVAFVQTRREDALATGLTAAYLCGLPATPSHILEFAIPPNRGTIRHNGIVSRRFTDTAQFTRFGINLHSWPGILAGLAQHLNVANLVCIIDAIVGPWRGQPEVPLSQLTQQVASMRSFRGRKKLLHALSLAREQVGSPKETQLRLSIIDAGLPEPDVAFPIYIPDLGFNIHVDLAYKERKLAIEYEGSYHYHNIEQFYRDVDRYFYLQNLGWKVIRVTAKHPFTWVHHHIRLHLGLPTT